MVTFLACRGRVEAVRRAGMAAHARAAIRKARKTGQGRYSGDDRRIAGDAGIVDSDIGILLDAQQGERSEEHTSELQSLMRISYAVFCLKKHSPTQVYTLGSLAETA